MSTTGSITGVDKILGDVTKAAADLSEWRRGDPKAAARLRWAADALHRACGQLLEEADELDAAAPTKVPMIGPYSGA